MVNKIQKELRGMANPAKARDLQRFFKTGKGEYAEGDKFLGVMVPQTRSVVKKYWNKIALKDCEKLIQSPWHEERLCALLILVKKFETTPANQARIFNLYLKNTKYINNWDLVDLSAPKIVGSFLANKNKNLLLSLAKSENLWKKRIAMLATFAFLRSKDSKWTVRLAEIFLTTEEDLLQKAAGWMLREMGKLCGQNVLTDFLDKYAGKMPRTMLRYSIEKLSPTLRRLYLKKTFDKK